jgi:hypothetical protein
VKNNSQITYEKRQGRKLSAARLTSIAIVVSFFIGRAPREDTLVVRQPTRKDSNVREPRRAPNATKKKLSRNYDADVRKVR